MMVKPIADIFSDAVLLAGLLDGLDAMQNESNEKIWGDAISATTTVARNMSLQLSIDIDQYEMFSKEGLKHEDDQRART